MAKGIYVGVDGVTRKMKTPYIGVGGVVKKVKKVFVGVGDIIKLTWSGEIKKVNSSISLTHPLITKASASLANSAIFGGDISINMNYRIVNAIKYNLTLQELPQLTFEGRNMSADANINYVVFAGSTSTTNTNAYNTSFVRVESPDISYARRNMGATNIGGYIIFSGGVNSNYNMHSGADTYNTNLVRGYVSTSPRSDISTASNGKYAFLVGGSTSNQESGVVEVFNSSLTQNIVSDRVYTDIGTQSGARLGDMVLFLESSPERKIIVFNNSLVKTELPGLSVTRMSTTALGGDDYALFAGGATAASGSLFDTVDAIDTYFVRTTIENLGVKRNMVGGARAGSYYVFAGGYSTYSSKDPLIQIDIYED